MKTHHYPDLVSASDWLKQIFSQSEALPRSWQYCIISMEFLHLLLRRRFVGKPVVASQNVSCFLRFHLLYIDRVEGTLCCSLYHRCNLTLPSKVCKAALRFLFWASNRLNKLPDMVYFEFKFLLTWLAVG